MKTKRRFLGFRILISILILLIFLAGYGTVVMGASNPNSNSDTSSKETTEQIDDSYIMRDLILMTIIITVLLIFLMLYKIFGTGKSSSDIERIQAVPAGGQRSSKPNSNLVLTANLMLAPGIKNTPDLQFYNSNSNTNTESSQIKCWRCGSPMDRSDMCAYCGWAVKTSRPVGYWSLFR
jgi:hypothetical protein